MKLIKCLLLLAVLAQLTACKKDIYQLPPETQTGANTFGCKINGKSWGLKRNDGDMNIYFPVHFSLKSASTKHYFFHVGADIYLEDFYESVSMRADSIIVYEGATIALAANDASISGAASFTRSGAKNLLATTNDKVFGELHFTKFDEVNFIASGTFWFDAVDKNGNIVHITEGRFDKKFTP